MNKVNEYICTQELRPFMKCTLYEKVCNNLELNLDFFVYVPYERLSRPNKRALIGQRDSEILEIQIGNVLLYRIILGKIGKGKLYLCTNGNVREITDETLRPRAKRIIRMAFNVTDYHEIAEEKFELYNAEITEKKILEERKVYNTYIRDNRPIERHKYAQKSRIDCNGHHYSTLGNYVGETRTRSGRVSVVKKSYH